MDWLEVGSYVIVALLGFFCYKIGAEIWLRRIGLVGKEVGEELTVFAEKCADGDLSKEDIIATVKEAQDFPDAIKKAKELGNK